MVLKIKNATSVNKNIRKLVYELFMFIKEKT